MERKCLGCHAYKFNEKGEEKLLFCSITCACMAGYMSVKSNFVPKHDMEELQNSKELQDELLNNYPVRVRDRHPCSCHHTAKEQKMLKDNSFH